MPVYDYVCLDCQKKAEVQATLVEKEKGLQPLCPACGSSKMVQFFGNMTVIKQGSPPAGGCCGPQPGGSCC